MILASLALSIAFVDSGSLHSIERDPYGVPIVRAATTEDLFHGYGRAVAQDRLWQMELNRAGAKGQLSSILGTQALAADRSKLATAYTVQEVRDQLQNLSPEIQQIFEAYVSGVNAEIEAMIAADTLPAPYAENGIEPTPFTVEDCAYIAIDLLHRFGSGGAGELRNYALYLYLQTQNAGPQAIDVLDDLSWDRDPLSPPTIPQDEPNSGSSIPFYWPTREITEGHLSSLPPTNLLELMPAIQMMDGIEYELIARQHGIPFTAGSYVIAVDSERSATGSALLLSGPQMGFTAPSVVHEATLIGPDIKVSGMGVPGIPLILIGHTPEAAWGITSGVTDIQDIVYSRKAEGNQYWHGDQQYAIDRVPFVIQPKDGPEVEFFQNRTHLGPIILDSRVGNSYYSLVSSYRNRELASLGTLINMYSATSPEDISELEDWPAVTFNLMVAFSSGRIAYHHFGRVPIRAEGYDPRLPIPAEVRPQGYVPNEQLPQIADPEGGVLVNWNNAPTVDWPNSDTPAWGRYFRNAILEEVLPHGIPIKRSDLELAIWIAARSASAYEIHIVPQIAEAMPDDHPAKKMLSAYDGMNLEGDPTAVLARESLNALRRTLFAEWIGDFMGLIDFSLIVQPRVIELALLGETRFDYLQGRSYSEVLSASGLSAWERLTSQNPNPSSWTLPVSSLIAPGQPRVPYSDRGTFIQIVEMASPPVGRSVLTPGNAQFGPHSTDQIHLARDWRYKPMPRLTESD